MIIVATDREYEIAQSRFKGEPILKTGVGALNVVEKLKNIPIDTPILNFGYVGSNVIPVGTEVEIGKCKLYHPKVEYDEPEYNLAQGDILCYTSNDFVTNTDITEPVVFDMELAHILALGFTDVKSTKIVSDTLNIDEYENTVSDNKDKEDKEDKENNYKFDDVDLEEFNVDDDPTALNNVDDE